MAKMRVHLDPTGGVAGDMFIAAILDAKPEWYEGMCEAISDAGLPKEIALSLLPHSDFALTGTRFNVEEPEANKHHHMLFSDIREMLMESVLAVSVRQVAIDIFCLLAKAEAEVHDKTIETISFHEVGEWDSIADIVGAAYLIDKLSASWTLGLLPLGRGTVQTSHGILAVPTPATVKLLTGFNFYDDGLDGERVTPTGAAILAYLQPKQSGAAEGGKLVESGTGFGTKSLLEKSNVLRVLMLSGLEQQSQSDNIYQIDFDIDDQSAEDLAIGLNHIRAISSVLDVSQAVLFGKKGRVVNSIRILAETTDVDKVFEACFNETTTIGLRYQELMRVTLDRWEKKFMTDGLEGRSKFVTRPHGVTLKVESDDLASTKGHANRERIRRYIAAKCETPID